MPKKLVDQKAKPAQSGSVLSKTYNKAGSSIG